jgi:hypothetical protein
VGLPTLIIFGDVERENILEITLLEHTGFETNKTIALMDGCAGEVENLFIPSGEVAFFEKWEPKFDHTLVRLRNLVERALVMDGSLFAVYKLVMEGPEREKIVDLAKGLWPHLKNVVRLYNAGLTVLGEAGDEMLFGEPLKEFMDTFELPKWNWRELEYRRSSTRETLQSTQSSERL